MRLPIRVFDLFLTPDGIASAQLLREDAANRAVQFLKQLAEAGMLLDPEGVVIDPAGVRYQGVTRELEVPYPSLKATRAAGLLVDDDALEAHLPVSTSPAEEPAAEEPLPEETP
jgi:hypothetical protein